MIKKNVAIALLIIALVLVAVCVYDYFLGNEKISSVKGGSIGDGGGNGEVGVTILPPTIEDKNNGG